MLSSTLEFAASRRTALGLTGIAAGALALPMRARAMSAVTRRSIDLHDPADHLRLYVKMTASEEDGAETCLVYEGTTFGVSEGTNLKPLYSMIGFSPVRTFRQPDGSYRFLGSEAAVFTDLSTGEVLKTWRNPYLDNREVEVWHLRTGPINLTITPSKPISTGGWGLLVPSQYGTNGFFMPVVEQDGHFVASLDAQANRKNPLDPAIWVNESSGTMMRYSEHNTWRINASEAADPHHPSPQIFSTWHTNKEWRPWMLMGQRPGHIYNHLTARKVKSLADAPRVLRDYYEKVAPEFLHAPTTWTGKYMTDWDYFKAARTPVRF